MRPCRRACPSGAFGPRLRAILSVLAGAYRLGKRPIRQLAFDLFGLSISTGMICRLERQGAAELEAPVEELREHVRQADSAHIDESSWKQGGEKTWLWVAVTKLVTVFTIAPTRGAEVARAMLGEAARKVVISDRFKSYHWIKRRQFCWAHTIRTQSTNPVGSPVVSPGPSLLIARPRGLIRAVGSDGSPPVRPSGMTCRISSESSPTMTRSISSCKIRCRSASVASSSRDRTRRQNASRSDQTAFAA